MTTYTPESSLRVKVDLGRVAQRALLVLRHHWAIIVGAATIFVGIPSLVSTWGELAMASEKSPVAITAYGLGTLGYSSGGYMLMGVVVTIALNRFLGRSTPLSETIQAAARNAPALFLLSVAVTFGVLLGALFFVIPALVLSVWWSLSSAVLVAEKRGVLESLGRSTDLTAGYRLQIFGLMLAYVALSWLMILGAAYGVVALIGDLDYSAYTLAIMAVYAVGQVSASTVSSVGLTSLYLELRTAKEGDGSDELASVFG